MRAEYRRLLRAAGLPARARIGLCTCGQCRRCKHRRVMRRWRLWREIGLRWRERVYTAWRRGEGLVAHFGELSEG